MAKHLFENPSAYASLALTEVSLLCPVAVWKDPSHLLAADLSLGLVRGATHLPAGEKRGVAGLLLGRTKRAARAAELQLCAQAPRGNPACRGTFAVSSRVSSTVSPFRAEHGTSLETLGTSVFPWSETGMLAQSTCPELSAQGLVPLRWGCALPSPNAPGRQRPAGSTHSSTRGLRPPEQLERPAGFPSSSRAIN